MIIRFSLLCKNMCTNSNFCGSLSEEAGALISLTNWTAGNRSCWSLVARSRKPRKAVADTGQKRGNSQPCGKYPSTSLARSARGHCLHWSGFPHGAAACKPSIQTRYLMAYFVEQCSEPATRTHRANERTDARKTVSKVKTTERIFPCITLAASRAATGRKGDMSEQVSSSTSESTRKYDR